MADLMGGVHVDVFRKCYDFEVVDKLREQGMYAYFRTIRSGQDPIVQMNGHEVIMLGSNNYLGLTSHPEVKRAAADALEVYGSGTAGSRFLNGTLEIHERLEEGLARFMKREKALTFSTGFQVNLGVLPSLVDRQDSLILDNLDHACILDGARLSFGRVRTFKHNDMETLEERLRGIQDDRAGLIVVDGVFSMEGDLSNLVGIVDLKKKYGVRLMVDDAHGIGVMGEHGRGTAEHFGVEGEVDLVMGTFSKALAGVGGFVVGDAKVIDFIKHKARTMIFSAAPPPASVASVLKAVEIIEREPERRQRLWENTRYMMREFSNLGFDTGRSASPVIPLMVGEDRAAFEFTLRLQEEGVFVNPVVAPAVPADQAMIRTSYMATHTREHLDKALEAISGVGRQMGVISG
ncbi:MAG: pyridoxal phosphate-dependent aminotransferase family protein [Thermoanaerobaculales bacterium]|nr:pyridoxal phosphate-dependent aminotransferase family protein [Thermoanaerobaculales bacterium]